MPRAPGLAALLLLAACWQLAAAAREDPFAAAAAKEAEAVAGAALGGDRVVLTTIFGQMPIKLYRDAAPETTKLVMEMAKAGCAGCKFYRNEGKPWRGEGPPYALLQGVMDLSAAAPRENTIPVKMGHLCSIPGTKDFFISYGDHPEWGTSHTVWGELENEWLAVDLIISQDYKTVTHPEHGTQMRMLTTEVKFTPTPGDAPTAPGTAQQ